MLSHLPVTDPTSPAVTPGVPRPPLLDALTSVRFFAALHVALYHLVRPFSRWGVLAPAMAAGYSGVSFFFVLSGFILAYSHAGEYEVGRGKLPKFWVARFARIYPVYLVSMLFAGVAFREQFHNPVHIFAYLADLLLLQSWSMRMINFFNSNAWTLSCEAFFYFVFPFVLLRIRPTTRIRAIAWIAVFFSLAVALPMLCVVRYPAVSWTEPFQAGPGESFLFLVNRLPLFALPEFLAGMSIGWLFLRFKPTARGGSIMASTGLLLMILAIGFSNHLPYAALHNGLLIPVYVLVLLGLGCENWLSRVLSIKPLVLLGEASYAFYLIHANLFNVSDRLGFMKSVSGMSGTLLATLGLATLMHLFIERPGRRAILAWYARRHPTQLKVIG